MDARAGAGSLGPRLAGRLTAELILRSPQYMNCVHMYEIDLRGNKIGTIENLGATENQFDSIDLSDNTIVKLDGFPKLHRLRQLLLNNNRIAKIGKNLQDSIPNLETAILTNNRISNLQDVDPFATLPKLKMLSLMGCPVATKPNYRLYVIARIKTLKVLDFRKVKQKEREDAQRMFPTEEAAAQHTAKTFEPDDEYQAVQEQLDKEKEDAEKPKVDEPVKPAGLSEAQKTAIQAAIQNAQTLEEIARLETALTSGHLPSEFSFGQADGKADETEAMEIG